MIALTRECSLTSIVVIIIIITIIIIVIIIICAALFALTRSVLSLHLLCMYHDPWHTQSFFRRQRLRHNNGSYSMDIYILPHMGKCKVHLIAKDPAAHNAGNPCAGNAGDAASCGTAADKVSEKIVVEQRRIGTPMRRRVSPRFRCFRALFMSLHSRRYLCVRAYAEARPSEQR